MLKSLYAFALILGLAPCVEAQAKPLVSVEQRIEAATRALGYFQRSHEPHDLQTVMLTLGEVNGTGSAAVPFGLDYEIREQQIKSSYEAWFLIFRTLDSLKMQKYDPSAVENRCFVVLPPEKGLSPDDPKNMIAAERQDYDTRIEENRARCERNKLQSAWPQMDQDAQKAFHEFLVRLSKPDHDMAGSYFAFALARVSLTAERSSQLWSIFAKRMDEDWPSKSPQKSDSAAGEVRANPTEHKQETTGSGQPPLCAPDLIDGTFTYASRSGEQTISLHFQNKSEAPCRLKGRAGASFAVDGHSMHVADSQMGNEFLLKPGERAGIDLHWASTGASCQYADWVDFFVDWAKTTGS